MVTIRCDICGKEILEEVDKKYWGPITICDDCYSKVEKGFRKKSIDTIFSFEWYNKALKEEFQKQIKGK